MVGQLEDLTHLRRSLRIDEVDPFAVEHYAGNSRRGERQFANPILEGIGGPLAVAE